MIVIRAALRHELDLYGALSRTLRTWVGSRNSHLFNRVRSGTDVGEKPIARLEQVVLHVDAVKRDVEGALRQTVDGRGPRASWRRGARHCQHQIQCITRGGRYVGNLTTDECSVDVG